MQEKMWVDKGGDPDPGFGQIVFQTEVFFPRRSHDSETRMGI